MYVLAASAPPVATNSLLSIVRHWIGLTCQLLLLFVFFFFLVFLTLSCWASGLFLHIHRSLVWIPLAVQCLCLKQIKIAWVSQLSPSLHILTFFFISTICSIFMSVYLWNGKLSFTLLPFYSFCPWTTSKKNLSANFLSVFTGTFIKITVYLSLLSNNFEIRTEIMERKLQVQEYYCHLTFWEPGHSLIIYCTR